MLYYQKSPAQVIFWQFANQTVNATVNYTNRSGENDIPVSILLRNFVGATVLAGGVAMGVKRYAPKSGVISRLSPFFAVCAANGLNTSLMRSDELEHGITVLDKNGESLGVSKIAAKWAVFQVVLQRVMCAIPAMAFPLFGMIYIEKKFPKFVARSRFVSPVTQVGLVGLGLLIGNPLTCAVFRQQAPIQSDQLEIEFQSKPAQTGFYNKGL